MAGAMKTMREHNQKQRDLISFSLFAAAILLGALASAKVMGFLRTRGHEKTAVDLMLTGDGRDPNDIKQVIEAAKETVEALKEKNLFVKQPPKQHPVKEVAGILGAEVLIAGKWYKIGGKIGDATIIAIGPTQIRVKWDDKEKTFAPLASAASGSSGPGPARPKPGPPKPPEMRRPGPPPAPGKVQTVTAPANDDPLTWMGVDLPDNVKEKLLEHWNKMSDEEKAKARAEWEKMPEDKRQEAVEQMERHL